MSFLQKTNLWVSGLMVFTALCVPVHSGGEPLKVCVTVPELGGLVDAIGGDLVSTTVFAKGTEDPHYLDARPSYIKALSDADVLVQVGLDLEAAWAPFLLRSSRNSRIQQGRPGFIDASQAIASIEIPAQAVDRSMGDVHPEGNPHYLADPLNGLKVAALLRDRLISLQPENEETYRRNYTLFRKRLGEALVGAELFARYEYEKLALLHQHGKLREFLQQQSDLERLSGWLGELAPFYGSEIVTYHGSWPYFANRFRLVVAEHLEPKPGIPPGPGHLLHVIRTIKSKQIKVLLVEPWINLQATQAVASKTGINVVRAATSITPGQADYSYIAAMDAVVVRVAKGFRGS